jgi:peroxiredoxin Q/BCP
VLPVYRKPFFRKDPMPLLNVGEMAPDFEVPNQNGELVNLSQFRGQHLVLWWYPKADTPG